MSEDGKNIMAMIKQMGTLFDNVQKLLMTIDDKMNEKNWEALNNTVMSERSGSIQNPQKWLPDVLFRHYKNNDYKNLLVFISILLNDDQFGEYTISEPYLSIGFFDYVNEVDVPEYWHARWFGYFIKKVEDNKIIDSYPGWEKDRKAKYPFKHWKCFGLPLTDITNDKDIEQKIINPLLSILPTKK